MRKWLGKVSEQGLRGKETDSWRTVDRKDGWRARCRGGGEGVYKMKKIMFMRGNLYSVVEDALWGLCSRSE